MKKQLCDYTSRCNPFLEPTSTVQCGFLAPGNNGSVSFWSSHVSFRVYCFANTCDTLFLSRDWRLLSSGVVWERENVNFIFNRGESSLVVLLIMLLSSGILLHCVHSDIYLISQASFFLRIISKLGNSFYLADFSRNHSSPSKAFFRARYSFIRWACFEDTVNTNQI